MERLYELETKNCCRIVLEVLGSALVIASADFFEIWLHASETIHVRKRELSVLKSTTVVVEQQLQVSKIIQNLADS